MHDLVCFALCRKGEVLGKGKIVTIRTEKPAQVNRRAPCLWLPPVRPVLDLFILVSLSFVCLFVCLGARWGSVWNPFRLVSITMCMMDHWTDWFFSLLLVFVPFEGLLNLPFSFSFKLEGKLSLVQYFTRTDLTHLLFSLCLVCSFILGSGVDLIKLNQMSWALGQPSEWARFSWVLCVGGYLLVWLRHRTWINALDCSARSAPTPSPLFVGLPGVSEDVTLSTLHRVSWIYL